MIEDKWEDIIRERLSNHEESYDANSWDRLSSKIDESIIDEEEVLSTIKDRLDNHQEPLIESHWQILKNELEALEQRRYRLWMIKSIEAITMLLLVWTFSNFGGLLIKSELDKEIIVLPQEINTYAQVDIDNIDQAENITTDQIANYQTVQELSGRSIEVNNSTPPVTKIPALSIPALPAKVNEVALSMIKMAKDGLDKMGPITLLPINALDIDISMQSPNYSVSNNTNIESIKSKNNGWWLGAGLSKDINLINSGFNLGYFKSQVASGLVGNSGSLTISYQANFLEIQTGLSYSSKSFAPGLLRSYSKASDNSYLENNLELINFDQIQVPIIAKIHGLNKSRNHLYGFVGVGANMILNYDYDIQKTVQSTARVSALDLEPQIDLTTLPIGFLQDGKAAHNYYLTGVIGVGLESQLSNKFTVFFQPQYQYQIAGTLNEYVQRIHNINLEAGVKFRL